MAIFLTAQSRVIVQGITGSEGRKHGARMIALAGKQATSTWTQLEVLMCQWRAIESQLQTPGPFILTATRTTLKAVPLT